jgi:nucleoid-associated protein YgaU
MFGKVLALAGLALVVWSVGARPLGAHGDKTLYRVQPHDTLWTIAASHYGGDVRAAIWKIEQANDIEDATIRPGETIVLP